MHKRKRRNEIFDLANGSRMKKHFFFFRKKSWIGTTRYTIFSIESIFKNAFINFNDTKPRDAAFLLYIYIERGEHIVLSHVFRLYTCSPSLPTRYLYADINMYLARIKLFAGRWNGSDPHSFISPDILSCAYRVSMEMCLTGNSLVFPTPTSNVNTRLIPETSRDINRIA